MNEKTKHRGPDGTDFFVDTDVSLGHNRLAILDLTPLGRQPMWNHDKTVAIVFNGEIYNFQELKNELVKKGHTFRGASDTEVIIQAYDAFGIDCVKRFNGIFAFALWDTKKKSLYLVRDHVGVKPLYYYWHDGKLIFSSEIKAILEHPIERKLHLGALNIYLRTLYVPAPLTMFEHIQKVEPGTYLEYHGHTLEETRYWQPSLVPTTANKVEILEQIRALMGDSVKRQLLSERPVGVFLSGGIDSTTVLGLAAEHTGTPVKTYAVGFDVAPEKFNADLRLAKKTSDHYGTDHHELIVTGADCVRYFEDVVYHMDEPVANGTQIATFLLSKFAREEIVVALGGDGGDELFGGYERYRLSSMVSFYQRRIPILTQSFFVNLMAKLPPSFREEAEKMTTVAGAPRLLSFMAQKESDIARIIQETVNNTNITPTLFERYFHDRTIDAENALMWADIRSWLPDESLVRSDKLSMAWGLEQRVPILDYRLVELSLTIPSQWKLKGSAKGLFKEAMRSYIPDYLLGEPKRGWTSPASEWLRTSLKPLATDVLSKGYNAGTSDLFQWSDIQKMLSDHVEKRAYHMNVLWALITFQLWYKRFMR